MIDRTPNISQQYGGYTIEVYEDYQGSFGGEGIAFKIIEILSTGKRKTRRLSNCNKPAKGKRGGQCRDEFGNKLYTPFETMEQALDRAKNYIDKHIVPWEIKKKMSIHPIN